jgi:hypothetical protein
MINQINKVQWRILAALDPMGRLKAVSRFDYLESQHQFAVTHECLKHDSVWQTNIFQARGRIDVIL